MTFIMKPMKEFEKEMEISDLKRAIKKAEEEGRTSDVEKLNAKLKELTHKSFWKKLIMY